MRKLSMLMVLVCMAAGCDDDEQTKPSDASIVTPADAAAADASVLDARVAPDAALPADGSVPVVRSLLPRPGLERPPAGKLPDDLKPPVR